MIFLSPDYVSKYSDVLGEILALARMDNYSSSFIEGSISHSYIFKNFEYSDVTDIAFKSTMAIYREIFKNSKAFDKDIILFSPYYWIGEVYIHLFLKYRLTFETLFAYFPLEVMEEKFVPFHEMGMNQFDEYAENVLKEKPLSLWLRKRNVFSTTLSRETGIPLITINYLKSGQRKIENLKAQYLEKIASYLKVDSRSLLETITLKIYEPRYANKEQLK